MEKAFLWIGDWWPSLVFKLVYSEVGQQIDGEFTNRVEGIDSPSLASLSALQLIQISDLQAKTQEKEGALSYRMPMLQQDMADQPLVGLAKNNAEEPFEDAIENKLKSLEALLLDADNLRLYTLQNMLSILSPLQAAQYLVATAQLQIMMRQIGEQKQALGSTSGTTHLT